MLGMLFARADSAQITLTNLYASILGFELQESKKNQRFHLEPSKKCAIISYGSLDITQPSIQVSAFTQCGAYSEFIKRIENTRDNNQVLIVQSEEGEFEAFQLSETLYPIKIFSMNDEGLCIPVFNTGGHQNWISQMNANFLAL